MGQEYKAKHGTGHPHFSFLLSFLKSQAKELSNNNYSLLHRDTATTRKKPSVVLQTSVSNATESKVHCLYHDREGHDLLKGKAFARLPYNDRKKFVYTSKLCYNCFKEHKVAECTATPQCNECSGKHNTIKHREASSTDGRNKQPQDTKGEQHSKQPNQRTLCTHACGDATKSKNCSKTVFVEITMDSVSSRKMTGYAIIDEQANVCLVDESVPAFFGKSFLTRPVTLNFASDKYKVTTEEQVVTGLHVRCINEKTVIALPEALTSDGIADTSDEVATPNIVRAHPHLAHFAPNFTKADPSAKVLLLIGRNCGAAMATKCYGRREPYAHKTPLALVGNTCVPHAQCDKNERVLKTSLVDGVNVKSLFPSSIPDIMNCPFEANPNDEFSGMSQEDCKFLELMKNDLKITDERNIQLPVPVKDV